MARQKYAHGVGHGLFGAEERIREFLPEIPMELEFGTAGIDQHSPRVVVDEEGHVPRFAGHLDPLLASAALLPFPYLRAVVIAGPGGQGSDHCVRTHGEPADFDHAHRSAANFRERRVENQAASLKQAESTVEKINPQTEANPAPQQQPRRIRLPTSDQNCDERGCEHGYVPETDPVLESG